MSETPELEAGQLVLPENGEFRYRFSDATEAARQVFELESDLAFMTIASEISVRQVMPFMSVPLVDYIMFEPKGHDIENIFLENEKLAAAAMRFETVTTRRDNLLSDLITCHELGYSTSYLLFHRSGQTWFVTGRPCDLARERKDAFNMRAIFRPVYLNEPNHHQVIEESNLFQQFLAGNHRDRPGSIHT